jgi:hypothetical protein
MAIERIVAAVDEFLAEQVHARFPAPSAGFAASHAEFASPLDRVEYLRERAALGRARDELRRTTAGLLFLRNKLEAEQTERRVRMARTCHALLRATREDDDETALSLLSYRNVLRDRIRHAEEELAGVRTQAADGKDALTRLGRALDHLERFRAPGRRSRVTRRGRRR